MTAAGVMVEVEVEERGGVRIHKLDLQICNVDA